MIILTICSHYNEYSEKFYPKQDIYVKKTMDRPTACNSRRKRYYQSNSADVTSTDVVTYSVDLKNWISIKKLILNIEIYLLRRGKNLS